MDFMLAAEASKVTTSALIRKAGAQTSKRNCHAAFTSKVPWLERNKQAYLYPDRAEVLSYAQ